MPTLLDEITIEDAIELFLTTVPRCIAISREGQENAPTETAMTNAVAGMFLFLLAGRLPSTDEASVKKMRRAFEVMWASVHRVGGNAKDTRRWLIYFGEQSKKAGRTMDRITVINRTVRERLFVPPEEKCPLDVWPMAISAGLNGLRGFGIRCYN